MAELHNNLGQVVHTYMPLYNLFLARPLAGWQANAGLVERSAAEE